MTCNDMNSKLPDLLFPSGTSVEEKQFDAMVETEIEMHLAGCEDCRAQLEELRATMGLLDAWEVPEPNPYFLTRFHARLEEEREAVPAGWPLSWFQKMRSRLVYGSRFSFRPVAAMAMTGVLLVGGGAYLSLSNLDQPAQPPAQTAVVHDLQTLDNNAQLLDQLESLSSQNND